MNCSPPASAKTNSSAVSAHEPHARRLEVAAFMVAAYAGRRFGNGTENSERLSYCFYEIASASCSLDMLDRPFMSSSLARS